MKNKYITPGCRLGADLRVTVGSQIVWRKTCQFPVAAGCCTILKNGLDESAVWTAPVSNWGVERLNRTKRKLLFPALQCSPTPTKGWTTFQWGEMSVLGLDDLLQLLERKWSWRAGGKIYKAANVDKYAESGARGAVTEAGQIEEYLKMLRAKKSPTEKGPQEYVTTRHLLIIHFY